MTNAATALPFDDIRNLMSELPGPDQEAVGEVYDTFLASEFEKEWLGRIQGTQ